MGGFTHPAHVAQARYPTLPLWARINAAVEHYGSTAPVRAHYPTGNKST